MTTTPQTGANWKAGGELKALHQIIKPVIAEDEPEEALIAPSPVGDNSKVLARSADEEAIEALAEAVDRALKVDDEAQGRAKGTVLRVGSAMIELRTAWLAREQKKMAEQTAGWRRFRDDGVAYDEIARSAGTDRATVFRRLRALQDGKEMMPGPRAKGVFMEWAAQRFGRAKHTLTCYILRAARPEKTRKAAALSAATGHKKRTALVALGRLNQEKHETLAVFKKALPALSAADEFALLRAQASRLIPHLSRKDRQEFRELVDELLALPIAKA